jgi:hypothetical protein
MLFISGFERPHCVAPLLSSNGSSGSNTHVQATRSHQLRGAERLDRALRPAFASDERILAEFPKQVEGVLPEEYEKLPPASPGTPRHHVEPRACRDARFR